MEKDTERMQELIQSTYSSIEAVEQEYEDQKEEIKLEDRSIHQVIMQSLAKTFNDL